MTDIIAALQEEIAAARAKVLTTEAPDDETWYHQTAWLRGYIQGLKKSVDLLTNEPNPLPFTAENGDCTFMENGDLR